jgi:dTDP-glucose pyrophosphorylase
VSVFDFVIMTKKNSLGLTETLWRQAMLPETATVQEVIRNLDLVAIRIVLITDSSGVLEGTISDGDIRRGLLRGLTLASPVTSLIHRNALVVSPEVDRDAIIKLMLTNKVHQVPVVDQRRRVIGLYLWDELQGSPKLDNQLIIMAGGKGERLRPHTENCPKPMLEVGGKPILEHIIQRAIVDGFNNFVISLHYLGHIIEDYFGDGSQYGIHIEYLREEMPLGTAGCLSLLSKPPELPFVITNVDVLTDINYNELLEFHLRHEANATMAVRQYEIQNQFGVVQIKGIEIEGFEEKPIYRSHVNAGIYVLNPNALKYLSYQQSCDMPTLFGRLKKYEGRTIVYPMHEPWLDVGRQADLDSARNNFFK